MTEKDRVWTRGKHQTKNEEFLVPQLRLQGAEFMTLRPVANITVKTKTSWCTNRGRRVQNSGPKDLWQALD